MTGHHMLKQRWYTKTIFSATAAATCFLLGSIFLVKRNQFNLSLLLNNDLATVDGGLLPPLIFPPKSTFAINSAPLPIALFRSLKSFHCELAWPSHDAWKDIPPESFWGFVFFFSGGKLAAVTPLGEGVKGNQKPSWITTASCRSSRSSAWEVFLNRRTSPGGFRTAGRVVGGNA